MTPGYGIMRGIVPIRSVLMFRGLIISVLAVTTFSPLFSAETRPNVVLILADDLGYADLGCYGGEIDTPAIDGLARDGLQFTHFRATPMCVTSRVALMAGMPMNAAGNQNYRHAVPLPIRLKAAGYRTVMVGKWHAGEPSPRAERLFDRSFGFLGGMTDSFAGGKDWFLDRESFSQFGPNFYATSAFADRSIEFMDDAVEREQPFFMYVAFNAPHHPCQAPQKTVEKYEPTYTAGFDAIRQARREAQIERGLIDPSWAIADADAAVRQWDQLSPERKRIEANRMAAYAAAVDEVDQATGRILAYLDEAGLRDNTLVLFLSDNGGDYSNGSPETDAKQVPWKRGANPTSSNGWAAVKCTPFRYFKHACHEGGLAVPCLIRWPAGMTRQTGSLVHAPTSITDIYPTLLELAGIDDEKRLGEEGQRSLTGASLTPLFQQDGTRPAPPIFSWYTFSRSWIEDGWKAVRLYDGPWQLFNMEADRGEVHDQSTDEPQRLQQLVDRWTAFAKANDVPDVDTPTVTPQRGWGSHRLLMVAPNLVSLNPANGRTDVASDTKLTLTFTAPIDFKNTTGRTIRLYDASNNATPIWQADPDETHPAQNQTSLTFTDLPPLQPGRDYHIRWDPGFAHIGGQPLGPLNNGAYWWRFRVQ